jgi:hypothetical protein
MMWKLYDVKAMLAAATRLKYAMVWRQPREMYMISNAISKLTGKLAEICSRSTCARVGDARLDNTSDGLNKRELRLCGTTACGADVRAVWRTAYPVPSRGKRPIE